MAQERAVTKVLVLVELEEEDRALLRAAAPEARVDFFPDGAPQDVSGYEVVIGNPPPGRLRQGDFRSLRLLQLESAGTNGYPEALPEGCALTNATGAYGPGIAEHLLGMTLMLYKKLDRYLTNQRQGLWRDEGPVCGLAGARVLVVGLGDIGTSYARLCAACGAHVTGVRRAGRDKPDYVEEVRLAGELDALLPRADIVALSVPQTAQTERLLSRERLALMKPEAIVLNAGRGTAIDTEALCDALEAGRLMGAGLDVTDPEPLPPEHRLWRAPNVLITPHVSGGHHLRETVRRIAAIAADNLGRYRRGEALRCEVDFATGYRRLGPPEERTI